MSGIIVRKRKNEDPSTDQKTIETSKDSVTLKTDSTENGKVIIDKTSANESTISEPPTKRVATKDLSKYDEGSLKCIGILPGIGKYKESSDSDKSTDTEDEYDFSEFDWIGRKIKKESHDSECN